ncbi:transporter, auxin efflux carrier domain protein [Leptospira borgpetersenii serovar Hardjo-bovis str. Sponselee]|uniref:Transporter, auxin efflux carrier domain protein n=3 Tax=Leptospira TaxID=171 RepID=M6BJM9_LEPBO|nr:AEC family transporter [Leptospira borgpetersenii]ABJ80186.1 Permease [Leptospira borgpetersenii serovar Hardjo-bovis str. L550]AMX59653.1 malate permease [Leptospira borgpetersenii serovar Hardjo]AMX62881.1 malate permease [Leptospira borgpetersenii serovar Hardjo]AMX66124.1 malate permease [Leptospira borgpetersenii serovar Hardjo]AMX69356.1 malate permease [Leptospira borgpetersenii serovar Hardjo]
MSHLILIPVCIVGGWILKRGKIFPENTGFALGNFVVYISLPALILASVPTMKLETSLIYLASMPWILFGLSVVFFYIIGKFFHWSSETRIVTTLCCGLGNTSFLGLPILRVLYGEGITNSVLIIDQFGTFLCLAIPGFILSLSFLSQNDQERSGNPVGSILKKLFTFPPFLALLFSFLLRFFTISELIHSVLKILGETLVPIALFTVGFQMEFPTLGSKSEKSENFIQPLFIGLIYKLLLAPILIFLTYRFLNVNLNHLRVAVLEAAMAPMITASIVSIQMGFRPALSAVFPGVGILISIPTLFLFYMFLENFF